MRGAVLVPGERSSVLWLNHDLAMFYARFSDLQDWPDLPDHSVSPGNSTYLGGSFTSPPVGVQVGADKLEVFGVGTDYALRHKSFDRRLGDNGWSARWGILGGDLTSIPAVVSTSEDRLDIFASGPDQGMLHRRRTGTRWSPWEELGGCFTSTPVVLASGRDTFDIFARGPDYLIYHGKLTAEGISGWAALGGGLLREPTGASAPAAVRVHGEIYVFVVAADWAMWFTRFDGTVWRPWSSLGGSFVSDPVAIALAAEIDPGERRGRIDVFGVHSDSHAMMHNWLEFGAAYGSGADRDADSPGRAWTLTGGQTWHGWVADSDVEGDGLPAGVCTCAPSISAPYPAATSTKMPPLLFEVVQPNDDGIIHQLTFNDGRWWRHDVGPQYGLPSTYLFNLNWLTAESIRSEVHDSNQVAATLLVGARPRQSRIYVLPDTMSNGSTWQSVYQMLFGPDTVELGEPVTFSWTVANSKNPAVADPLALALGNATEDYVNDSLKGLIAAGEPTFLGSFVGALFAVLLDSVLSHLFDGCDGIVDVGVTSYPNGRVLQKAVLESPRHLLLGSMTYVGEDPGGDCGAPHYKMQWAIKLVQYPNDNDTYG